MSKIGSYNIELEDAVYSMIDEGEQFDVIVEYVRKTFKMSDNGAYDTVGRMWDEIAKVESSYERFSHGVNDMSDDAEALASAGWGTDEDYGGYSNEDYF